LDTKICPVDTFAHVTLTAVRVCLSSKSVPEFCVVTSLSVQYDLKEYHPLRPMSIIIIQYNNLPVVTKLRNRMKRGQFACKQPHILVTREGKKTETLFKMLVVFLD
jgi:hypothetical protein